MINDEFLNSLDATDKEGFKKGLEDLINQTYVIEEEYKSLNESYLNLQSFFKEVVDTLPSPLWVVDERDEIFLQNSEAQKLPHIFRLIDFSQKNYELEDDGVTYLIKIVPKSDKKIVQATDITGQKRKERLASMGQISAHLAHEIRNPIGSISLLASTLLKKVDERSKPIVSEMKKAIWRVERIIRSTLLFSKGISVKPTPFYLDEIKDDIYEALSLYSYTKEIGVHVQLPHIQFLGDKDLLCMVFQNLLFNAIDAIEEDDNEAGRVDVNYEKQDDSHKIIFMDSGIEVENPNILFEPFKSTKIKGNGLGLSLSLQIIEVHGGSISLEQKPKAFVVRLN